MKKLLMALCSYFELLCDSICTITRDPCERRQISGHIVLVAFKSRMQMHYCTAVRNQ